MPVTRTRIKKLSHSDTILYEIYMFRFSRDRLIREKWENERDAWVYLESFFVHYRNLIEFLGKPQDELRQGDIHITNLWTLEGATAPSWVSQTHNNALPLWTKYEKQPERISRYLQHCTTQRVQLKDWPIDEMNNEIEPLLSQLETVLVPTNPDLAPVPAMPVMAAHSASTAVCTATAVVLPVASTPTNSTM
jgi:hypothetical protein